MYTRCKDRSHVVFVNTTRMSLLNAYILLKESLPLTDATMNEGKCSWKQHEHHHHPKSWELIGSSRVTRERLLPHSHSPGRNGVRPACSHCVSRGLTSCLYFIAIFCLWTFYTCWDSEFLYWCHISMALHSQLLFLVWRKLTKNSGILLGILLSHWPHKPPNIQWSNISQ